MRMSVRVDYLGERGWITRERGVGVPERDGLEYRREGG